MQYILLCRGFKLTGPFVSMIYRMLANDLIKFCSIYFIFVMGFSQAYYIIFQVPTMEVEPLIQDQGGRKGWAKGPRGAVPSQFSEQRKQVFSTNAQLRVVSVVQVSCS